MLLSIIVPCYNEEEALPLFYPEIKTAADALALDEHHPLDMELLFVDDGSTDGTLPYLKTLRALDSRVHFISFSRNFGKEAGLLAGLKAAKGDLVVVMDADLQDPPALLPEMVRGILDEGYDCVCTRRVTRKGEPPIRSWFARRFYHFINSISDTHMMQGVRDFRLMTRKMVDAVLQLSEVNRFSKGLFSWVGFKNKYLEFENVERVAGTTKWSFWNLFVYAIEGIISFSTLPIVIATFIGLVFCILSVLLIPLYAITGYSFGASGFPTMIFLSLLIGGLQLFCLGIIGQYLSKTYLEVKRRPSYIVREEE